MSESKDASTKSDQKINQNDQFDNNNSLNVDKMNDNQFVSLSGFNQSIPNNGVLGLSNVTNSFGMGTGPQL